MNWIEKMIAEQCPEGVKRVKLGEVAIDTFSGATPSTKEKSYWDNGTIRWMSSGDVHLGQVKEVDGRITQLGYDKCSTKMVPVNSVVIALAGQGKTRGTVAITRVPLCTNQSLCAVVPDYRVLFPDFIYYFLKGQYQNLRTISSGDGTRGGLNLKMIRSFKIPLPPLSIQEEIVSVLGKFSELIEKTDEEIALRQKQYEYYREKLLTFEEGEYIKVSSFAELKAGKAISANELSDIKDEEHPYPCYGGNGIRGYINKKSHNGDYAIIGRQGALCGCVSWATGEFYATEHAVVVTPKNGVDSRFLNYFFINADLNQYKSRGAQPGLAVSNLNELKYILPPLSRQQSIVETLDKFEALIAKLKEERELRQKQYEYYREKLLTF